MQSMPIRQPCSKLMVLVTLSLVGFLVVGCLQAGKEPVDKGLAARLAQAMLNESSPE